MTEPAYSFTIPSVHDDTILDCRIYNPTGFAGRLPLKGAVVAHPYAPLGGSYDDLVVLSVAKTLLARDYVVYTFSFRGAGGSEGNTSWTGRPEIEDYISMTGFAIYHLQHLADGHREEQIELSPIVSADERSAALAVQEEGVQLVLGGYSYGSLVLARLPAVPTIIERFDQATVGTAPAEIILRARTLAMQFMAAVALPKSPPAPRERSLMSVAAANGATNPAKVPPITMGGETNACERNHGRVSRRSVDVMRKSFDMPRRIMAHVRQNSDPNKRRHEKVGPSPNNEIRNEVPIVAVRYLLISPVILPFSTLICPPGPPTLSLIWRRGLVDENAGALFLRHTTLAVFGTNDAFTSKGRLRAWALKQASLSAASDFEWEQVQDGCHFWREERARQALQHHIGVWLQRPR